VLFRSPSPVVMAFAYGASAAIWHRKKGGESDATADVTRAAAYDATAAAAYDATAVATDAATDDVTRAATDDATAAAIDSATLSATDNVEKREADACAHLAGELGLQCARRWEIAYQGGNMWAGYDSYLTSCRDILGLELTSHGAYAHWEQAAIHGGFRVMHEEFCIVSDFPEFIKVDENNQPHCDDGPSHRWRDGWSIYYWHGVKVPQNWVEERDSIEPTEILKCDNVEQRAAGCALVGWSRMLDHLDHKIIDSDSNPEHGDLIEVTLDGLPEPEWYLRFYCPRNGLMMEGVNKRELSEPTVFAAQAWKSPIPDHLFSYPKQRS